MADKKISELPDATLPIGAGVKFEAVQGGVNVKVDATDMPGSGGSGTVESVTGDGVDNTDPDNPVLTFPVASEVVFTPAGNIAATDVQAGMEELDSEKMSNLVTTRTVTATHELDSTDLASINAGRQLEIILNSASPLSLEIPTNAVQAFPIGTVIGAQQYGAGQVTIAPDGGVTMRSPNVANKSFAQYSKFFIEKIGTNEWVLSGDITV